MGSGIAQVGAQTGHSVTIIDTSEDLLAKSQNRIGESIKRVAKKKFKDDSIGDILIQTLQKIKAVTLEL